MQVGLAETVGHDGIKEDNIRAKEEIDCPVVAQIASCQTVWRMAVSVAWAPLSVLASASAMPSASTSSATLGLLLGVPVLVVVACSCVRPVGGAGSGRGGWVVVVEKGEVIKDIGRTNGGGGDNGG